MFNNIIIIILKGGIKMASIGYVINEAVETPSEMTVLSDKNNR